MKRCGNCGFDNDDDATICCECERTLPDGSRCVNIYEVVEKDDNWVSTLKWLFILVLLAIPIVNIVVLVVMICTCNNKILVNFAKASLILGAISFFLRMILERW